jgi:glycosyltransferase involved in cell wall biosynthesis
VRAAEIACRQHRNLYFLLAGLDVTPDQHRRRKIEGMVRAADLSPRVLFLGHRTDVARLLRGADVLVNPSREEALGGALIEAIGHGLPCVATDTGGTAEIVPPGRCGFLVPREDHEALALRTVELVNDEQTRRTFARNARAHFDECFTLDRCAEQTAAFFDEIIEKHRRVD